MDYTQVLVKPLISEKATWVKELGNQVVFYIDPRANKIQVKQAVEKAFNVTVQSVNIVRRRPLKRTRSGRPLGKISGCKKAYVTLAPGSKIEFFEGV